MVAYHQTTHESQGNGRRDARSHSHQGLEGIQRDILKTLLYFDIFDFPLRLPEIYQFLPTNTVALTDLRPACFSLPLRNLVSVKDGYCFLQERPPTIVDERKQKERRAGRMWFAARVMSRIIGMFPFVRAAFVSGELSKGVASKYSDIDFYLVTAPNRVWIVRSICAAFKRIFLFNKKKFFCYNHIVSESQLEVSEKSLYAAIELATLKPMWNNGFSEAIFSANAWVKEYLPNWTNVKMHAQSRTPKPPMLERLIDRVIASEKLDRIDERLLGNWRNAWHRRYSDLSEAKRQELFRCTPNLSTSYVNDFYNRILHEYNRRLCRYGLLVPELVLPVQEVPPSRKS